MKVIIKRGKWRYVRIHKPWNVGEAKCIVYIPEEAEVTISKELLV